MILSKTFMFRLSALAFVCFATPALAFYLRGVAGLFAFLTAAGVLGFAEGAWLPFFERFKDGLCRFKWFFLALLWYFVGLCAKVYYYGDGLADWRLVMSPVVLFLASAFAVGFLYDERCYRHFQIMFLTGIAIQSAFLIHAIVTDVVAFRTTLLETHGAWVYGDQAGFALVAMVFPTLVWRAFKQTGLLKVLLLACCVTIAVSLAICTFATPVGLLFLAVLVVVLVSLFFPITRKSYVVAIFFAAFLSMASIAGYIATRDNPLLGNAYYKLSNVVDDPKSGGYRGRDAEEGSRWMLSGISINSFLEAPLFGRARGGVRNSTYLGGHSSIFDYLGGYGMLGGGMAYCFTIFFLLAVSWRRFASERSWETMLCFTSVLLLVVGGVVNPYWDGWQPAYVLLLARPVSRAVHPRRHLPDEGNI
ncbi:hypothetical protein [Geomonas oryzae]|uniref:hypothetical protein n=1 Tax=Geomonas oryzae TaxID=2364273 RepID=UPI00100A2C0C|nr:hypothetical protein [Geomonas oryzae]